MKTITIALTVALAAATGATFAQSPGNHEIYPPGYTPPVQRKYTAEEKAQARAQFRQAGVEAARADSHAEGMPIPDASERVPREERRAARVERKAESRRANKAGEITSHGETGDLAE